VAIAAVETSKISAQGDRAAVSKVNSATAVIVRAEIETEAIAATEETGAIARRAKTRIVMASSPATVGATEAIKKD
jgi:hypothetical protein